MRIPQTLSSQYSVSDAVFPTTKQPHINKTEEKVKDGLRVRAAPRAYVSLFHPHVCGT